MIQASSKKELKNFLFFGEGAVSLSTINEGETGILMGLSPFISIINGPLSVYLLLITPNMNIDSHR